MNTAKKLNPRNAKLCHVCTTMAVGESLPSNDLVKFGGPQFHTDSCSGCGFHYFDKHGIRACGFTGDYNVAENSFCHACIEFIEGVPDAVVG